jgi:hypothetical protein
VIHNAQDVKPHELESEHPYLTYRMGGWRQLAWPVDDNYLGRFCTGAGPVREAGLT